MSTLSPNVSSILAKGIYKVDSKLTLHSLTDRSELSGNRTNQQMLDAKIGSRLINTQDQFAVCLRGSEKFRDDIFLIFRGTVGLADWVTDARMGLNVSSTGSLVHSGFSDAFNSVKSEMAQFTIPLRCWLLSLLMACLGKVSIRSRNTTTKGLANIITLNVNWVAA